jgi:SHS2 domain-containing protein
LLFKLALGYTFREVQENRRVEVHETHQRLLYVDVNLLGENLYVLKKSTDMPLDASKKVGLEIIAEKTKYIFVSCH